MEKKKLHNYSFRVKEKPELKDNGNSRYEWVEVAPGKMRLVKKVGDE